ncbi:MAG: TonB-dependent receptor [Acidobacteria bacterium]|nr:TonB-dependent receptor [Acidobacteriota bacterium]
MRQRTVRLFVILTAWLALPMASFAQQEAVLSGTITDTTGGVLPGVVVRAVHEATGNSFEAVTDEAGGYRLAVRVGIYRMSAELSGFSAPTRAGIEVLVGQQVTVNIQMQPATLQESVTVTAEAPLVDVTRSRVSGNIDPRQMQELPVNGRNWMNLTILAPGSRVNKIDEIPIASQASSVGVQMNLDGQQVTNMVALGFGQPRYSRDAIGEFEFVANRFDASQGRSMGVQVNAVTKSGTNQYAGTFSGYFRSDRFNAADPVTGQVLPYSDQQLSTTFGGPIRKDKFHFFASFEYEREPQTFVYNTPYPKFNGTLTGTRTEYKQLGRVDYQFSPQNRLSVRISRYDNRIPYDSRYTGGSDRTMASAIGTNRRSEQALATWTQVLSNRVVNEVKGGHSMFHWNQYAHVRNPNALPGMTSGFGAPNILMNGFTLGQSHAITPQDIGEDFYTVRDDMTLSFNRGGRHDLRLGGEYMYHFTFETVCNQCMGQLDLRGGPVPRNIEDLIVDVHDVSTWNLAPLSPIARFYQRAIGMDASPYSRPAGNSGFTEYAPRHVYAGWVQDNWSVTPRLTLNLGLRYDLSVNEFVNWVAFPPLIEANRPNDTNNWGPRLGFAYQLTDKTVVRGGYGVYYAEVTGQPAVFTLRNVQQITPQILNDGRPDFASNPFTGPAPNYEQAAQRLCTVSRVAGCLRANVGNFVAPDLKSPFSHQASLGLQRQLGEVIAVEADWVYTGNRDILTARNINISYNPSTGANYPFNDISRRPLPDWGNLSINRPDTDNTYQALQVALVKRMSRRWQASATYSLGAQWNFDQVPLNPGCSNPMTWTAATGFTCDVPVTLASDIAENDWYLSNEQRHRVTFNGIWDAGYGFQLSGLYIFGDDGWETPLAGVDVRQLGGAGTRLRADGTLIERNSFDRKSMHRVDLRVQRRFRFGSRVAIDGIAEVFNLFDRANYETYELNERNARFGRPNTYANIAYAPRVLQLGFRTQF